MKEPLMSETNTPAMERRVLHAAARARLGNGRDRRYQADFEHGQWWITETNTGAQWSAHDCQDAAGVDYFGFEQVTKGDED